MHVVRKREEGRKRKDDGVVVVGKRKPGCGTEWDLGPRVRNERKMY